MCKPVISVTSLCYLICPLGGCMWPAGSGCIYTEEPETDEYQSIQSV